MTEVDVNRDAGDPAKWESAELRTRRPAGVMISVRVAPNLAEQIDTIARTHDLTLSDVVRMALANFANSGLVGNVSFGMTGTTRFDVPLRLTGPTVSIRTETHSQATQQEFPFAMLDASS